MPDRSGSAQYNQRLSLRRAETVAAELVRHGISRNEIVVQAFGESRPLANPLRYCTTFPGCDGFAMLPCGVFATSVRNRSLPRCP